MTLQTIDVPDSIKQLPLSQPALQLIDQANERIEAFMLSDQRVIENFVTCDFHLVDQALHWIQENHLLAGNRFCEWGSGFGVAAMLASVREMESLGIEIEPPLVEQACRLADRLQLDAGFYCGSFVPRGLDDVWDPGADIEHAGIEHVETDEGDVYEEIGLAPDEFDLFFAFPWPGEHTFFEAVFEASAADGSLLLTYRGREGMNLVRKV